jgi:hypothetical protein
MSIVGDLPASSGNNPDLEAMHRNLVALVRRLEESIDLAPDAQAIAAITEQMAEVNARVTSTGRVLLAAQTDEIARYAKAVSDAMPAIEREIETLQDCERMVRSVASLLGTIDEAVRVATLACG